MAHIPVLQKEVLKYLDPKPNDNFIDCTLGDGGHAKAILEKNGPAGKILGIEWDPGQVRKLPQREFGKRLIVVCDNFANLKSIVQRQNCGSISGIIFDLGMSSWHFEASGRGFTFRKDEPLDMRYNEQSELTAERIVNHYTEKEIVKILKGYGQERFAKSIAGKIVELRNIKPIKSTFQLVEAVMLATPVWYHYKKIHPATRTFQALRIATNRELENISKALPQTLNVMAPGGRLVIISFHSLEDKLVKNFFREQMEQRKVNILTKKPVLPSEKEIKSNPRCRSARLRAISKP